MSEAPSGVRSTVEPPAPAPRPQAAFGLVLGGAAVLLAGQPASLGAQVFSTGGVLRAGLLALFTAAALFSAWIAPVPRMALGSRRLLLLLAPLGIALLGLPALAGTAADAARDAGLWTLLALLPLGYLWTWSETDDAGTTLRLLVPAGCVAALLVLIDAAAGGPAVGPFGRSGIAGPVLAALAVVALLLPFRALPSWGGRWLPYVPCAVLVAAALATRSRTAGVALLLGMLAALAAGAAHADLRKRLRIALALAAALAAVVLGLMVEDVLPVPGSRRTVDVRLGLHRASLDAMQAQPLTGYGAGGYATAALRHRDLEEARLEPGRRARHAHMDALHVGVEGGLPAALLFLVYVAGLGVVAVRASLRSEGGPRRARAAALGIVVTLGVAGLGDGILIDPAPVLLLALAAAVACMPARIVPSTRRAASQTLPLVGGLLCLGLCYAFATDALSDRALMQYRHAILSGVTPREADRAAQRDLVEGALRWRPEAPEALYRLGVHYAMASRFRAARDTFRDALRADPAMTEARLDLAQVYQLEERYDDARAVLEEALRHDPTRYDVPRRLMELALGPEPPPGDPPTPMDELQVLRWKNLAASLAPDRFENFIDESRFARRRATDAQGLARSAAWVRQALKAAPGDPKDPPAEVLIESFRLGEAEGTASPLFHGAVLMSALRKNPRPARRFGAEAARFLDMGDERESAALARAGGVPANVDMSAAQRAYDAAAVRMTALLYAGQDNPDGVLALARIDRDAGRFRRALARYRSLLAWTLPPHAGDQVRELPRPKALLEIAREGDLLLEAASVAHRVDKPLANFYRTRGQLRIGFELLLKRRFEDAGRKFRDVLAADPDQADAHFGLARVLARTGEEEEAEAQLIAALRLKPALRGPALAEPDLLRLHQRPRVRLFLGLD